MEQFLIALAIAMIAAGGPAAFRFFEKVFMRGDVNVWLIPVDPATGAVIGPRILHEEKKNLIVATGKTIMARLLGGDAAYKNLEHIGKIGFGTDGTAAASGQTALLGEQFEKAVSADYPAFNQVRFTSTMEAAEGGSHTYREIGLKTNSTEKLFSRLVISPIEKSAAYKIQVEWVISFQ